MRSWQSAVLVGAVALATGYALLSAFDDEPEPEPPGAASVTEIVRGQDAFRGRRVIVHGDVAAAIEPGAFTLGQRGRQLLVLAGDDALGGREPGVGQRVTVEGRVVFADPQILDAAGFDAGDERYGAFERRAAILATAVTSG